MAEPSASGTPIKWRNRIVGHGVKPASEFVAHPLNWRIHPKAQSDALEAVLEQVGWVQAVIESANSGYVLDGHDRIALALRQGDETPIPFIAVDVAEQEELIILATFDPLGAMAVADKAQLDALLRDITTDSAAIQAMLAGLAESVGLVPPNVTFAEYDESVADEVEYITCPECGHKWPK